MTDAPAAGSLVVSNLTKIYKGVSGRSVERSKNINLIFQPSEFISIIGPSGCGKSTY